MKLKDGKRVYQLQVLSNYDQAKDYYNTHHQEHCTSVTSCLKSRLAWSDLQLIRDVILVLATHGWEKVLEGDDSELKNGSPMEVIVRF